MPTGHNARLACVPTARPLLGVSAARFAAALLRARGQFARTETVTPDGTRLATWLGGAASGRPVVLLHGFCSDHTSMRPLARAIADRLPVVLYDARGHGESTGFLGPARMRTLAEDLLAVLAAHAPNGADVVGLSMGAQTVFEALRIAEANSFARFVFIDQSPCSACHPGWPHGLFGAGDLAEQQRVVTEIAAAPRRLGVALFRGLWRSAEHLGIKLLLSPALLRGLSHMPEATLRLAEDMLRQDWREDVRRVTQPTLLMYGGRSVYPDAGRWMATTLPHAELLEFVDSGHVLVLEEPERAARAVRGFLVG